MMNIKIDYNGEELEFEKVDEEVNSEMREDLEDTLYIKDSLVEAREKLSDTIISEGEDFYG